MPSLKDTQTNAAVAIDYPHHEIHSGDGFRATATATGINNAAPKRYRVTTPNTTRWAHFTLPILYSSAAGTWELFEDPTLNAAGTAITARNSNRNSGTAATVTVFEDTTVQAPNNDGTRIWVTRTGSGSNPTQRNASSDRAAEEWILKQNEDYILKFTQTATVWNVRWSCPGTSTPTCEATWTI